MKVQFKDLLDRFPEFEYRNCDESGSFEGFSHDSREIKGGEMFIPIVGDKFDGHDYIGEALSKGASVSLCEVGKVNSLVDVNGPLILVDSIEEGLQKILNYAVSDITVPIIAITGSTGKTTTKQMLVSILSKNHKVLYSDKSNTVWGNAVLLSEYDDHDFVVLECAMDRKGEIAWHVNSVDPDIGVLLNVGYVHAEKLGSIEEVYKEKKDLADYMERTGKPLVLNIDDERLYGIKENYNENSELITFGKKEGADYQIADVRVGQNGTHFVFKYYDNSMEVELNAYGEGYVYDAMAAIIVANKLSVPIGDCIENVKDFRSNSGRFEKLEYGDNLVIVNDAYNANPDSMKMSLDTFSEIYPSEEYFRVVILGDMRELGDVQEQKHRELGEYVLGKEFDKVYYVGDLYDSFGQGENISSADEVAAMLNEKLDTWKEKKVAILLKASNSIGLYLVPDFLKKLGAI